MESKVLERILEQLNKLADIASRTQQQIIYLEKEKSDSDQNIKEQNNIIHKLQIELTKLEERNSSTTAKVEKIFDLAFKFLTSIGLAYILYKLGLSP